MKLFAILLVAGFLHLRVSAQVKFIKHILTTDFVSEGVAVADVNKDGKLDILAGAYWFEAPNWTKHELTKPQHYDPLTQYSNSFLDFALDVNQDGWVDLIRVSLPGEEAVWYENPGAARKVKAAPPGKDKADATPAYWKMHYILKNAGNESPAFVDMNGDGRGDLLCNDPIAKQMIWMESPSKKGDTLWKRHIIGEGPGCPGTDRYTHGLGRADMNADGRPDVIITAGWWECPPNPATPHWKFHPVDFGQDCSQIYAQKINGLTTLISASAHDYGIWWHQPMDSAWAHRLIFNKVSETHALAMGDINKDGHPDLVTGKRYYAHNGKDPGAHEPSLLYWFEYIPGPKWIPHLIDDRSGVGLQALIVDLDKNGTPDIVISNKNGVFFFEQKK